MKTDGVMKLKSFQYVESFSQKEAFPSMLLLIQNITEKQRKAIVLKLNSHCWNQQSKLNSETNFVPHIYTTLRKITITRDWAISG